MPGRHAYAIVAHAQHGHAFAATIELHHNSAFASLGECIFERIGHQLAHQDAERGGIARADLDGRQLPHHHNAFAIGLGGSNVLEHGRQELIGAGRLQVIAQPQAAMGGSHGVHPQPRRLEGRAHRFGLAAHHLQRQQR